MTEKKRPQGRPRVYRDKWAFDGPYSIEFLGSGSEQINKALPEMRA